jgi:protein-S-isoprenylcysteine O-methyltransferase Ste14
MPINQPQQKQKAPTGAWLFRWRSYFPLIFIAILIPAIDRFTYPSGSEFYDQLWEVFCLSIAFIGLLIRCCAIGYTPKGTSGRNTKSQVADTLNIHGIYSIVRNPLYLGNSFMALGVVSFLRLWWVDVIYVLAFWLYYERIIWAEEAFLAGRFGEIFHEYRQRTPVFMPKLALWQPNIRPFSFRNILKREYPSFFGVIASMTALEAAGNYAITGQISLDTMWIYIFSFSVVLYLTLRTLKKRTRILHVEGR